ncbi:MAG: histidine kinase [Bacteroidales bacterium]
MATVLLLILLLPHASLFAQNFNIKSYTTSEGLAHNNIRAMVRDSSGFIWIGTWDGLSRFDGHEFKNYFHSKNDSVSLPFFSIRDLSLDKYNNLWILTDWMQVAKYNRASDNFTVLKKIDTVSVENVVYMNTDYEGNLWIINKRELIRWDEKKQESKIYKVTDKSGKPFTLGDGYSTVYPVSDSEIWLAGLKVIRLMRSGNNTLAVDREYTRQLSQTERFIDFDYVNWYEFYCSPSGAKWIFTNIGLFRLDENAGDFREYRGSIPAGEFKGKSFFCWGWRNDGIYIFNTLNGKLNHIPSEVTKMPGAILSDDQSSFWFSSTTSSGVAMGLKHLVFTPDIFKNHLITDRDSAAPAVYSVIMDKNENILVGLRGYNHILKYGADGKESAIDKLSPALFYKAMHIRSMIPVNDGIWIGYYQRLLQFYDYKTGRFKNYFPNDNTVRTILPDKDNNIFIGTIDLSLFHPATGRSEVLWRSGSSFGLFKMYLGDDGILWGAMAGSRFLKYDTLTHKGSVIYLAGKSNVEDIIPGDDGELWLALLGDGVCRYDTKSGACKYYTTSEGLSNNTTYNLLRDRSGYIWVSTNKGISRINPYTMKIRTYGPNDGLAISEFNSGAKFMSRRGEFFFGGMGGFVRFFPDSITFAETSSHIQKILITGLEVSGSPRHLPKPVEESDTIRLLKGEDNFHFTFTSTDFVNSDKIIFRYRLADIDRTWTETGAHNLNINYTNLDPGWYHLLIEGSDSNGEWSTSKNIVIRITPNFYETGFFIIMVASLLILALAFSIIFYIRNVKHKERQKQDELKLQSLRGQMNPHFIFNSLNSINYFISNNDRLSANRYIADFSRLIRSILANMGNNFIPFENELSSIEDYLRIEHLRFGDKFDYKIETAEISGMTETEVCPGIVQPFVENAIWHGVRPLENRKGFIRISFKPSSDNGLKCIIEDDGVGRMTSIGRKNNNDNHRSRGISIVSERLQITSKMKKINYKLEINDLYPGRSEPGTRVEVDIPVIKTKT